MTPLLCVKEIQLNKLEGSIQEIVEAIKDITYNDGTWEEGTAKLKPFEGQSA